MIPYGKQSIDRKDIAAVVAALTSDYLTQGPRIPRFEGELAKACGSAYAVVFNSGTAALHGAYHAAGLSSGDEFITTPLTFAATANAGLYCGAKPVFADVEADTGNISADSIAERITRKTRLIVPVHYGGHPADMAAVRRLAKKAGAMVVEDACHALGARYRDHAVGSCSHADMAVFSFHPVKHITTGEGGAVTTNSKKLYESLLRFRSHGITKSRLRSASPGDWYYEMQVLGFNYRMTDIQAALGSSQLVKLKRFVGRRREIAARYGELFRDNPFFHLPPERDYARSSYHLYPVRLKDPLKKKRARIFAALRKAGIGVQVHYIPVHLHPYYRGLGFAPGSCPAAEDFYRAEISLPIFPDLSDRNLRTVVRTVLSVMEAGA